MQREEPYQSLKSSEVRRDVNVPSGTLWQVLHGCRKLVSWDVWLSPVTSATPILICQRVMSGTIGRLPGETRRKAGTRSSHHGPYGLGYTRATMGSTEGCESVSWSQTLKTFLSPDWSLQLDSMKSESLVIANQNVAVNTFSGLVHTARHIMEVGCTRSG